MRILILGVFGQDGTIAREFYLKQKALVVGVSNRENKKLVPSHLQNAKYIDVVADFADPVEAFKTLNEHKPDRILNFAAAHESSENMAIFENKFKKIIHNTNYKINANILEWLKSNKSSRYVMALSSQMYTPNQKFTSINEESILAPQNYYGETKKMAFELIKQYRRQFDVYSVGAILFNHASRFSKEQFLFQQLASQISDIINLKRNTIKIRDFDSLIDITLADEIVNGLNYSLELSSPEDFVFASGKLVKIRDLTIVALNNLSLRSERIDLISSNPHRQRYTLIGNPSKAENVLNWRHPTQPSQILLDMVLHKNG